VAERVLQARDDVAPLAHPRGPQALVLAVQLFRARGAHVPTGPAGEARNADRAGKGARPGKHCRARPRRRLAHGRGAQRDDAAGESRRPELRRQLRRTRAEGRRDPPPSRLQHARQSLLLDRRPRRGRLRRETRCRSALHRLRSDERHVRPHPPGDGRPLPRRNDAGDVVGRTAPGGAGFQLRPRADAPPEFHRAASAPPVVPARRACVTLRLRLDRRERRRLLEVAEHVHDDALVQAPANLAAASAVDTAKVEARQSEGQQSAAGMRDEEAGGDPRRAARGLPGWGEDDVDHAPRAEAAGVKRDDATRRDRHGSAYARAGRRRCDRRPEEDENRRAGEQHAHSADPS